MRRNRSPANSDIALRNVGRFIVDGLDVLITADVNYKAQTINASLPAIAPIPNVAGAVAVYLDAGSGLLPRKRILRWCCRALASKAPRA